MANRQIEAVLRISAKAGSMAGLDRVSAEMGRLDRRAKAFNRSQTAMARMQTSTMVAAGRVAAATARYIAPAALAYGTKQVVVQYAELERQLTRTGLKIGASRKEMADLNTSAMDVAQRYAVANQAVVETIDAYAETGAELKDIRADLDGLVKAQQAMGAEGRDVIGTWDAGRKSFGLMSKDAERFFDIIAAGGNSGKFEGSDLSKYLPSLMPTAAVHGMGGLEGTAQIVGALEAMRDRTGESGTAATSLQDFMDKLNSPDVQKNFMKFNIDLPRALAKARKDGVPLFETLSKLLQQATHGDASKLGALFGERDSRNFALMLMQDIDGVRERIRKLREESKGTIQINVDAVTKDSKAAIDRLSNSYDRMMISLGEAASAPASSIMDKVSSYLDYSNAVKRGLEREGKSGWDDYGLSTEERHRLAVKGGYKTAADRQVEAQVSSLDQANQAYRGTGRTRIPSYAAGMDVNGVPYPRIYVPGEYSDYGQLAPDQLRDVPSALLTRRNRGNKIGGLLDAGADQNYVDFITAAQAGAGEDLRQAGDSAGQSISQAAEAINRAGEEGGSAFARMLEGIGARLGQEAAASFNANVRPVPVDRGLGGRPPQLATGNPGRTMPNAGRLPGPI